MPNQDDSPGDVKNVGHKKSGPDVLEEPEECKYCEARACGMCSDISNELLHNLRKMTRTRNFTAGEVLFSDQEDIESYATLKKGIVKLSKLLPDGRQQTLGLGFPPDFLGRPYREKNNYFVNALTDVTVCTFPHSSFNNFLKGTPSLEHRLFELTLNELDQARNWMLLLGQMSALEKVVMMLLHFADKLHRASILQGIPSTQTVFQLPLSRAEIAEFLGLTVETVSRQFSLLKKRGLISLEAKRIVEILDRQALEELCGSVTP